MRTTITIDDKLVQDLREGYGIEVTGALVRQALVEMRQRLAADRLIALGGSDPDAKATPRRRPPRPPPSSAGWNISFTLPRRPLRRDCRS